MKEYKYKINGNTYKVAVGDIENNIAQVEVNGTPYRVELDEQKAPVKIVSKPRPSAAPRTESGAKVIAKPAAAAAGAYQVKAPLPGTVVSIAVKVGDTVAASDTVAVLEAMKMEMPSAPAATARLHRSMYRPATPCLKAPPSSLSNNHQNNHANYPLCHSVIFF